MSLQVKVRLLRGVGEGVNRFKEPVDWRLLALVGLNLLLFALVLALPY